jgi:cation diffusion facilitator CzcD-associated flavoprotein CzcO
MELNYWAATEFEGGAYDDEAERWSVVLRRTDGSKRKMHPRHVVLATGVSGIPNLPDIPTLRNFSALRDPIGYSHFSAVRQQSVPRGQ